MIARAQVIERSQVIAGAPVTAKDLGTVSRYLLDDGPVCVWILDFVVVSFGFEALVLPILGILYVLVVGVMRAPLGSVSFAHNHDNK